MVTLIETTLEAKCSRPDPSTAADGKFRPARWRSLKGEAMMLAGMPRIISIISWMPAQPSHAIHVTSQAAARTCYGMQLLKHSARMWALSRCRRRKSAKQGATHIPGLRGLMIF